MCRVAVCGYDAAVGRFTVAADEARTLRDTLKDPDRLRGLVREPRRVAGGAAPPTAGPPGHDARVSIEPFSASGWTGLQMAIVGEKRSAYAVMLEQSYRGRMRILMVFAAKPDLARRLAIAAAG